MRLKIGLTSMLDGADDGPAVEIEVFPGRVYEVPPGMFVHAIEVTGDGEAGYLTVADIQNATWPAGTFFCAARRGLLGTCRSCGHGDAYQERTIAGTEGHRVPVCDECAAL